MPGLWGSAQSPGAQPVRRYVLTRLLSLIPTLLGVSLLVFVMVRLIPGTVVEQLVGAEAQASPEMMRGLQSFFGLDRPLYLQYLEWMGRVLRGDLGTSWRSGFPVLELILSRLQVTAQLTIGAMLVALLVGIPFGVVSAVKENSSLDHVIRVLSLISLSLPIFWQASMLVLAFSLWLHWAVPVGYVGPLTNLGTNLQIMLLPSMVLGTVVAATVMRMTRSALLDVLRQDYIRTAWAKGLRRPVVLRRHALKNAMIPVITVAGLQMGYLLGGTVVAEEVFTLPGVGRLLLLAISQRDYPLVQGAVLFVALLFVTTNLAVDLLYGHLDPRIRYD